MRPILLIGVCAVILALSVTLVIVTNRLTREVNRTLTDLQTLKQQVRDLREYIDAGCNGRYQGDE